jgi:tellurite resistance protein TerC
VTDALDVAVPLWAWFALGGAIVVMLAIDLALHRDDHVVSFREAAIWSGIWIGAGLAFGLVLWSWQGGDVAATYYSAYLIEKALSVDNVFIFALIFGYFAVPARYQHRVLFWGVIGALLMRLVFIFVGSSLLETFFWTAYVFGLFLVYTGWRMAFRHGDPTDPGNNPVLRIMRRVIPVTGEYDGNKFFTRVNGKRAGTMLLVALVAIESSDLIFAIDSVAAVLAITTNTFIVWASIAMAVLGLRALYFCLAGLLRRFVHLHYGLAFLLVFAGVKLILSETPVGKLPIWLSLSVILGTLAISIIWSLRATRKDGPGPGGAAIG